MRDGCIDAGRSKLVYVGAPDMVFRGLAATIREGMPGVEVVLTDAGGKSRTTHADASLVLVDVDRVIEIRSFLNRCRSEFPKARLGVVVPNTKASVDCVSLLGSSLVEGIVPVDTSPEVWLAVIHLLLCGGEYCPPRLMIRSIKQRTSKPREIKPQVPDYAAHGLTPREGQILELITRGFQNKQIANFMSLSEHTVKVHVHNLFNKLGVNNRTQAATACRDWMSEMGLPERSRRPAPVGLHLVGN